MKIVQVQFFDDKDLSVIQKQMNKFFKEENITADRIMRIEYQKHIDRSDFERYLLYTVMVVYT